MYFATTPLWKQVLFLYKSFKKNEQKRQNIKRATVFFLLTFLCSICPGISQHSGRTIIGTRSKSTITSCTVPDYKNSLHTFPIAVFFLYPEIFFFLFWKNIINCFRLTNNQLVIKKKERKRKKSSIDQSNC